jgi:cytidylate kinase
MDLNQKLEELELQKLDLIAKRQQQITKLINRLGNLVTLPDELIVGSLLATIEAHSHNDTNITAPLIERGRKYLRRKSKKTDQTTGNHPTTNIQN